MNLEIGIENRLTFEIENLKKLDLYKIFLIIKSDDHPQTNKYFEEHERNLEDNLVTFIINISSNVDSNSIYNCYINLLFSDNRLEESFVDSVIFTTKSIVDLITIPANTMNLKEKTYETEISFNNIVVDKE